MNSLAVVEDDGAVGPAVVVDQTQVGKQADAHRMQTSLIAHHEPVTVDLAHMSQELRRVMCSNVYKHHLLMLLKQETMSPKQ